MNRDHLLGLSVGLAAGLLVAVLSGLFGYQIGRAGHVLTGAAPPPAGPAEAGGAMGLDAAERIAAARQMVDKDPSNRRAWVDLGNAYFDAEQPQKSIDAYGRALELQPDDPDVLTDQGVMFRAVGAHDKAIANFEKANRIAPQHLQSLYNLGVVYGFDLGNAAKAEEAWNRIIQLAPSSENAEQARRALARLRGK